MLLPFDPAAHCRVCRNFLRVHLPKSAKTSSLGDLRRTVASGCARCPIVLAGVQHFSGFWHNDVSEEEVGVCIIAPLDNHSQDILFVILVKHEKTASEERLELEFYTSPGARPPFPEFRPAGDLPREASDVACLRTVQKWMQECEFTHSFCRAALQRRHLPKRLLDISQPNPRLTSGAGADDCYAALSHSWGEKANRTQPVPKTTRANLSERQTTGVGWNDLTKSFQDGVTIARRLGLRYIWIDALCIIQDDKDDWAIEASRMGSIYENAHIVISATLSKTGDDGCFSSRSPSYNLTEENGKSLNVSVKRKVDHREFTNRTADSFKNLPLFDRAWAFQERLLATRVLHYTPHELVWECKEQLWCECGGIESDQDWEVQARNRNFKFHYTQRMAKSDDVLALCDYWNDLVDQYTARSFTSDSDRLPALSAVASQMQSEAMGRYLAGLWEARLPYGLLWRTGRGVAEKDARKRRPSEYRGPSWSWVSVEGHCWGGFQSSDMTVLCRIAEIECTKATADPFGHVSDGFLILEAPCIMLTIASRRARSWETQSTKFALTLDGMAANMVEDVPLDDVGTPDFTPDGTEVLVAIVWRYLEKEHETTFAGIVLRPSLRVENAWERIGLIGHTIKDMQSALPRELKIV